MYYLYGKINRGHSICPLYGGRPLFGESAIRGFTVCGSLGPQAVSSLVRCPIQLSHLEFLIVI